MITDNYIKLLKQTISFAACYLQNQGSNEEDLKKLALFEADLIEKLESKK